MLVKSELLSQAQLLSNLLYEHITAETFALTASANGQRYSYIHLLALAE